MRVVVADHLEGLLALEQMALVAVVVVVPEIIVQLEVLEALILAAEAGAVAQMCLIALNPEATAALVLSSSKSHLRISLRSHRA